MILFFSSPIGLGHITRDIAIMDKIKRFYGYNNFGFVTGSTAFDVISKINKSFYNHMLSTSNLYNPPNFSVIDGKLVHGFLWVLKYLCYYHNCKSHLKKFFYSGGCQNVFPDLIISDEDFASLGFTKDLGIKRVFVTDVLNTRFGKSFLFSQFEKVLNHSMCNLIKSSECVILPEFGEDKDNFFYVGPIVREIYITREALRKKLSFDRTTILVSTGGTDAGLYLLRKTIESFSRIRNSSECELVILSTRYAELPKSIKCRYLGIMGNGHEFVQAADLVISLGGKSTIDECMVYGTPGIFIPIRNHFEQEHRAKLVGFKYDDIFKLDGLIEEKLCSVRDNRVEKVENGVSKAAKIIYQILNN
jgi:UDP-N-acetylglucosamine--N-acetylmuramyl-(pentapeptide) pyrophosphoryl-undecaprenol N-acetylglucosamine transferase